ncbi:serine hydrolase domain-containing protein [Cellulosimicrobium cellulans]|uniref:serine hydrolase domain-containing protein n=1 Tax=Cellulosimicrobium cellulans TaxID=1710 RepID=UPI0021CAF199|nr:serine hydrolase domain-containing protein [Cellulosimicrobium cellulans]
MRTIPRATAPDRDADPSTTRGPRTARRAPRAIAAVALLAGLAACAPAAAAPTPAPERPAPVAGAGATTGGEDASTDPATVPALSRTDVDAWLDGFLPAALDRTDIPGAAVAVVHDGQVVTTRGYGWADTGTESGEAVPVDPDRTLFRPGSVSKLVTATAVMQLVEAGDVDLDTDVSAYVDIDVPRSFDDPITLRHLLTHTAGFEERIRGLIGAEGTPVDLRAALAIDPPEQVYRPGTVPAYSNYGNALAGYVVERVSGEPFEQYVREHVLEPAGMTTATFGQPVPADLRDRLALGYGTASGPSTGFEVVGVAPAGALSASAADMARFMLALLGEPPTGEQVLDADTLALMQAPALDEDDLGTLAGGLRMGLGFFQEDRNGHRVVGHGGDTNAFHSHLQLYPDERTGVFVSVNGSGAGALDSLELREQLMQGFADRYFPPADAADAAAATATGTAVDADTAREHAAALAGAYTDSRAMRSTFLHATELLAVTHVTAEDDGRVLVAPGPLTDRPVLYEEVEPWVWQEVGGQRTIAARAEDGRVTAIGYDSAFTLLPAGAATAVALPALGVATAVLLVGALAGPVAALVRRVRHRTPRDAAGRTARVLTRVAAASAVLAVAGWAVAITTIMGLVDLPEGGLRVLQVLQGVGILGLVPATVRVVGDVRRRAGGWRLAGGVLVLLALGVVAWFAVTYRLVAPSLSY